MNYQPPTRRAIWFIAILSCLTLTWSEFHADGQEPKPETIREFRGQTMGTTYMFKVPGSSDIDDQTLQFSIDAELRHVNDQMSTYLKSSEISRFNQSRSTEWFEISKEFASVVQFAIQVSLATEGAFDVTVAPLVNEWSFGSTRRTQTIPDQDRIDSLRKIVGFKHLDIRLDPPAIRKHIAELQIDLSSIAKGHGVDRVISKLEALGVENAFVEIGGEVRTIGDKSGQPWRVGIQLPDAANETVMLAHAMQRDETAGTSMATSGDYRNFFVVDGKRYSHTIDPRTGFPVTHAMASVTVVAATCMEADAWATALSVLGPEQAAAIARKHKLHTLTAARNPNGDFVLDGTGILAGYAERKDAETETTAEKEQPAEATSMLGALVPVAILSFGVFAVLLFAMAIGVLFGRRSISGSCGGIANKAGADGTASCALCSNPSDACRELREKMGDNQSVQTAADE